MDNTKPHGTDIFNTHYNCRCADCRPRREAVHRLVDSFSQISHDWFSKITDQSIPLPMWGTLFIPKDSADVSNIERLLVPIADDDEESQYFADAGWQDVADTGIIAIEFDDELVLGIHGAGYDFYTNHWSPLYDALGYHWHEV